MKKTRYIPYGYTIRNGITVIEHTEAEIIREIFDEYIKGATLKEIANSLTARKIPYTEKTDVWDKARIARIIDNSKYTGSDDYDPIIAEDTFEEAISTKASRQRYNIKKECEALALLRYRVKCHKCGSPMIRKVCSKYSVKESWTCTNDECGMRVRITDTELLLKITLLMNRIIENTEIMIPRSKQKSEDSPSVQSLQREIDTEIRRDNPSEELIITKVREIASQLYRDTQAKTAIAAQIARKRALLMKPQDEFNCTYFSDLISYITIDDISRVTLHTKTDTEIKEGDDNGSH